MCHKLNPWEFERNFRIMQKYPYDRLPAAWIFSTHFYHSGLCCNNDFFQNTLKRNQIDK